MKISDVRIDNFGVWSDLELNDLSGELSVLYGPNETGKSTLLEFVRAMFYGFESARRYRYLPPLHPGVVGGTLHVRADRRKLRISRHDGPTAPEAGLLTIRDSEGAELDSHLLDEMLTGVDESIYRNVFAVGLDELQQLRSLSDGDASRLLYDLSMGLDRVSLFEVLRELKQSRSRLLSAEDRPSQIPQLVAARNNLQSEIDELASQSNRYWQVSATRESLGREVSAAEAEAAELEEELRLLEVANSVRARWQERSTVQTQLESLGEVAQLPVDGVARLGAIHSRLQKNRRRLHACKKKRKLLRLQADALPVNDGLWKQSARIEALAENEPWILSLENQLKESESEIARLTNQISDHSKRVGLNGRAVADPDGRWLVPVKSAAASLKAARRRMIEAKADTTGNRASADAMRQEINTTLSSRPEADLHAAMEETGQLVSQLRRRIQLDDRLDQMARSRAELQENIQDSLDQQVLPVWQLVMVGLGVIVGVSLIFMGMFNVLFDGFFPGNAAGLIPFGVVMAAGAGLTKYLLEHAAQEQLDADQKQLAMLKQQIAQVKGERDEIDQELPNGGGHLVTRLQKAEKELAALEELVPLSAKAQLAEQQSAAEKSRLDEAVKEYKLASKRWKNALAAAGLPENLTLPQVKELASQGDTLGDLQRKLQQRREEAEARKKEYQTFQTRVNGLLTAAGIIPDGGSIAAQLRQLRKATNDQESIFRKREDLRSQIKLYEKRQRKCRREIARLTRRRRSLMRAAGALDEADFTRRVQQWAQIDELRSRFESLEADIATTLGSIPADEIEARINDTSNSLEARIKSIRSELETVRRKLQALFERRGDLGAQLKVIAEDRRLGQKRLELAAVKKRLQEAIERWQMLGITEVTLEEVKQKYETERQPAALLEASEYLQRLTEGRYRRVWTPLDANELKVEDRSGQSIPVEVLSRGTREQLFLSLRLAVVSSYVKRGAALPLVLDDVLVNFDVERATAAAELLQDFAAAGHQLLVFTCHEHILKIFRTLRADCRPLRTGARTLERLEPVVPKKKKRIKPILIEAEPEPEPEVVSDTPIVVEVKQAPSPPPLPEPEPEPELILEPEPDLPEPDLVVEQDEDLELIEDGVPTAAQDREQLERLPEFTLSTMPEPVVVRPEREKPKVAPYLPPPVPRAEPIRRGPKKQRRNKSALVAWGNRWDAEEFAGELADRVDPAWRAAQIPDSSFKANDDSEAA